MEFVFDQTQIPIIGSKYWDIVTKLAVSETSPVDAVTATTSASNSGTGSRTTNTTASDNNISSWKRPASSQVDCHVITAPQVDCDLPHCRYLVTGKLFLLLFII